VIIRIGDLERGTKFKFIERQNAAVLGTYMVIRQLSNTVTVYAALNLNYSDNMLYEVSSDVEVEVKNIWEELERALSDDDKSTTG